MELSTFFQDNVHEKNPYFQFKKEIGYNSNFHDELFYDTKIEISSTKEAIRKFRELCQPDNDYNSEQNRQFILICFYLYQQNTYIVEFPELLSNPVTLNEFAYGQIRTYLIEREEETPKGVPWQARRNLINHLKFSHTEDYYLSEKLNNQFQTISTRNADFYLMSEEEKLKEIGNMMEYALKRGKKYEKLDIEKIYKGYISNESILSYKKLIQCFRHSSQESLEEREKLKENYNFLISYGLAILAPLGDYYKSE